MDPLVKEFLKKAVAACRKYDKDNSCILPFEVWPSILDDLAVDDSGEECKFLMSYLDAAGEGNFTYEPIEKAVAGDAAASSPPPTQSKPQEAPMQPSSPGYDRYGGNNDRSSDYRIYPDEGNRNGSVAGASFAGRDYPADTSNAGNRDVGGYGSSRNNGYSSNDGGYGQNENGGTASTPGTQKLENSGQFQYPTAANPGDTLKDHYNMDAGYGRPASSAGGAAQGGGSRPPSNAGGHYYNDNNNSNHNAPYSYAGSAEGPYPEEGRYDQRSQAQHSQASAQRQYGPDDVRQFGQQQQQPEEEVNEGYWQRRGQAIQRLFTRWDCNELSNGAFTAQLQEVLGLAVDVSSPESEFVKLANRHERGRNMKFAALMSALRRDAQATSTKRFGRPLEHTGLSCYGGSYAGSQYEPSVAGDSDYHSQAAGKPTMPSGAASSQTSWSSGRKHFSQYENRNMRAMAPLQEESRVPESPAGSAPGGYWQQQQQSPLHQHYPQQEQQQPYRQQQHYQQQQQQQQQPEQSQQSYRRGNSSHGALNGAAHQQPSSMSALMSGAYAASEVASVAESLREETMSRNRYGHGNILTWGDNSRDITPGKQRHGRQICVDEGAGIPRSAMSSGTVIPRDDR
mmetsp:Transcript_96852/g.202366  ORF Transcript_96852/g.202366 Transcript_96852/m.202366 type:complete len:624 (-) Transcript_96852:24-1895(-)